MTVVDVQPELFSEADRLILAPVAILPLAEWADTFRFVTSGPVIGTGTPVRWTNDLDPLNVTVMAAVEDSRWGAVCFMGSPQRSAKTELAVNLIAHTIHQRRQNVFYHNASAAAAADVWKKKTRPAFEYSPELADLIPADREEAGTVNRRDFSNGTSLFMRGSDSRAALAQATAPVTIADDVQAMLALPDGDHPVDLGMERADSYPVEQRRHLHLGQPGTMTDYLATELFGSTFYVPFVLCPKCGTLQMIEWDRFRYDTTDARAAFHNTTMQCCNTDCTRSIADTDLPEILANAVWVSTPPGKNWLTHPAEGGTWVKRADAAVYPDTDRKTTICGFWRSAFYWPFTDFGEMAVKAIESLGNPEQTINFSKRILAIPYAEPKADEDALEPTDIYTHAAGGHRWKTIPKEAGVHAGDGVVLVTADVQAGYIWYLVEAWNIKTGSSWLIECGRFGSKIKTREEPDEAARHRVWRSRVAKALDQLWAKDHDGWPAIDADGVLLGTYSAAHGLIDCSFLRETVQTFCKLRNGGRWLGKWLSIEGSQCRAAGRVPVWPGMNKATTEKKTRRRYWECNTNRAKLWVRDVLAVPPGSAGSLVLPEDMPDQMRVWYARHLCAEEWVAERGKWKLVSGENHLLDAKALQLVGAMACEVKLPFVAVPATGTPEVVTDWFAEQKRRRKDARRR